MPICSQLTYKVCHPAAQRRDLHVGLIANPVVESTEVWPFARSANTRAPMAHRYISDGPAHMQIPPLRYGMTTIKGGNACPLHYGMTWRRKPDYSYRRASIGFKLAAFHAG